MLKKLKKINKKKKKLLLKVTHLGNHNRWIFYHYMGFHGGLAGKESAFSAGDPGSIPGSGRSPEEGNGYPLQYSCLENPMDRGTPQATQSMGL